MVTPNKTSRTVPMEILVLGLCRTGTQSLADALTVLGYHDVYHMREVRVRGHTQDWINAIEAKYEHKGQVYGRAEYDGFLGNYAALTDLPAAMFPEDLVAAYPSAKVILTVRGEDGWYTSMERTIWHSWIQKKSRLPDGTVENPLESVADKFHEHLWKSNFEAYGRKCYREHNQNVRKLMSERPDDFIEFDVREGWEPLCQFLGKQIPSQDFPRSDDWVQYKKDNAQNFEARQP